MFAATQLINYHLQMFLVVFTVRSGIKPRLLLFKTSAVISETHTKTLNIPYITNLSPTAHHKQKELMTYCHLRDPE